jgi:hypothetical protein
MRKKSLLPFAGEKAMSKICFRASLLNRVKKKWRWTGEVPSQLTINADEERGTVTWMGVASVGQVRTIKLRKWR